MEILVNGFYLYRIWMVSKHTTLVAGMILIFVARIATFIFWLIRLTLAMHLVDNNGPLPMIDDSKLQMAFDATTSLAIGLDIAMTGAMIYYLRRCRAPNQRTRGVITWLLMYYVNTGAILASLSIAVLISVKVSGKEDQLSWLEPVHLGILNIFAKVMANSFFGVLNSRQLLRTKMAKHIVLGNNIFVRDSTLPDTNIEHIEISMETRKRVENI
ncbi:hypothetical protein QCA50_013118 [Cerrena zonata]|uniref:DUF6534 domain-containing protein n=1 Tax=Cerrena zonata TaxID=2478898 RepID=A0AAW0G2F3_9APHY